MIDLQPLRQTGVICDLRQAPDGWHVRLSRWANRVPTRADAEMWIRSVGVVRFPAYFQKEPTL